jgi:folate-dependent phosphoribosylglycinamide formyltransferase PurN
MMKIVLLCDAQHNQVALANKIAERFSLGGIVVESRAGKIKSIRTFSGLIEGILNKTVFNSLRKAWFGMLDHYKTLYDSFPATAIKTVSDINDDATIDFINLIKPDLLMVSGTSLLRKKILSIPVTRGIINLHTGLSPYIKGGPNCTNWCIATGQWHLIGNSVMWIDAGIDSGDLICTSLTTFTGMENLLEIHIKVMDHAHQIYLDTVKKIRDDFNNCPRVKQSGIASGVVYYNKQWNWRAKLSLVKNLKKMPEHFRSEKYLKDKATVITVG